MTQLSYQFVKLVFTMAFFFIIAHLVWGFAIHPYLTQQMNDAMSQVPSQYSGIFTSPAHAIQPLMNQLPGTTTGTGTTLP